MRKPNYGSHERRLQVEIFRICDWDDPSDVALYYRERREKARNDAIDRLAPGRICRVCKTCIPESTRWVVTTTAICRSCYMNDKKPSDGAILDINLFRILEIRYVLDWDNLKIARERSNLSVKTFAYRCGWSHQKQLDMEFGRYKSVTGEVAHKILEVLNASGVVTLDHLD